MLIMARAKLCDSVISYLVELVQDGSVHLLYLIQMLFNQKCGYTSNAHLVDREKGWEIPPSGHITVTNSQQLGMTAMSLHGNGFSCSKTRAEECRGLSLMAEQLLLIDPVAFSQVPMVTPSGSNR